MQLVLGSPLEEQQHHHVDQTHPLRAAKQLGGLMVSPVAEDAQVLDEAHAVILGGEEALDVFGGQDGVLDGEVDGAVEAGDGEGAEGGADETKGL